MKKRIFTLLLSAIICCAPLLGMDKTPPPPASETSGFHGWKNTASAIFLFAAGAWLAHRQLPRLAGQEIHYDSPAFTKALASLFFTIGITGSITGACQLTMQLYERLNRNSH